MQRLKRKYICTFVQQIARCVMSNQKNINNSEVVSTWFVVRSYNGREKDVSIFFKENTLVPYSLPEDYRNIVFIPSTISAEQLQTLVAKCPELLTILIDPETQRPYQISEDGIRQLLASL